ncbi:MAG: hypothetical protein ACAH95_02780 [Fimbriimonas sp.]
MPSKLVLTEEQLRDVLERAEELQHGDTTNTYAAVIEAAKEAGLSEDNVTKALQERLGLLGSPPAAGELIFAKGTQNRFFAAEVIEQGEHSYRVRFLNGGEHSVRFEDLRPLNLFPGEQLVCPWPDWGWWTCSLVRYDPEKRKVRVSDNFGTEKTFDLSEVFRADPSQPFKMKLNWLMVGLSLGSGVIGSLLTWLAMR